MSDFRKRVKDPDKVLDASRRIQALMSEIGAIFTPDMKLTLLARAPDYPDGSRNMVVSTEADLRDAGNALITMANYDPNKVIDVHKEDLQ